MNEKKPPTDEQNLAQSEKGYYEELNEQIAKIDYANYEFAESATGSNGFTDGERKFGFIFCSIVTALMVLINIMPVIAFVFRPRELTKENYQEYIVIEAVSCGTNAETNQAEYEIRVSRRENSYDISNFSMTVEAKFELTFSNSYVQGYEKEIFYELTFSDFVFEADEVIVRKLTLPHVLYTDRKLTVISVSGGM